MKGWIKVHGKSEDGRKGRTMYVRTEHIVQVSTGVLAADESKEATCIAFRGEENSLYAVTESVEEVFALIEEAEKPQVVEDMKDNLREWIIEQYHRAFDYHVDNFSYELCLKRLSQDFQLYDSNDEELLASPISKLELSVRTTNSLKNGVSHFDDNHNVVWDVESIRTIRELTSKTSKELLKLRNFSKKSLSEVREKLAKLGLCLKDDMIPEEYR